MSHITEASYIKDYKIYLVFNDKKSGIVDLSKTICGDHRPIFKELKNQKAFRNFKVDMDTIVWSNGLDLAPEFLHDLLIKQQKNGQ
jgi:hypothetical protein